MKNNLTKEVTHDLSLNQREIQTISKKRHKQMMFTLLLVFFTEVLGFTIMMPVLPFLAQSLGMNVFQIQLLASIFSFCQFFASPITGKLSDRYGRKPLLLISQFSTFIGFLLLAFANNLWFLVAARIVDGLLGSNMTVAQAAMSDITNPEDRTKMYSISSGVFGAGLIIGPGVGGLLAELNYALPMFSAAGVSLISILLVIFILPETYQHKASKISLNFEDIFPIEAFKKYMKKSRVKFQLLMLIGYNFAFMFFISSFTLILIEKYLVSTSLAGLARTYIGILRVFLQFFLVNKLLKKIGENSLLKTSIISMILAMISLIFSPVYWIIFIPMTFLAYGTGLARPILTSQLTNSVDKTEYATALGINNSLNSLMQIFSPLLGGLILLYINPWPIMVISSISYGFILLVMRSRRIYLEKLNLTEN